RSFNEFQLILCRNVLIYFDKPLQEKVLTLFDESLESLGFLALGTKETLKFTPLAERFQQVERDQKIWRKDRKSTRLNSSHVKISYAVFCLKKKKTKKEQ